MKTIPEVVNGLPNIPLKWEEFKQLPLGRALVYTLIWITLCIQAILFFYAYL